MTGSIMVISLTATSATAASIMAVDSMGLRVFTGARMFMAVPTFTRNLECTLAGSAALITAEMPEAFPPAGGRALEVADSTAVAATAVVDVIK
jgi:hypothetical protein